MKILLLGPVRPNLINYLLSLGDKVVTTEKPLTRDSGYLVHTDFIISYGYRYILKKDILNMFPHKAVNLHISLLPWNRGADPNLWSFLENTPKGVTIHYIDEGIDTGDIIAQEEVNYFIEDTLRTSYERLSQAIESLFKKKWPYIKNGQVKSWPQPQGGSYHSVKDRALYEHLLTKGWDTPVIDIIGKALQPKRK